MALFHLSVTQTKRSAGQSAIASAAYRAGERLYSEYYGEYSDYTRKGGVICSDILLPSHAPPEYADRQTLWNAVEKVERGKNAQLAYSFDIALQNEFSLEENIALARQFLLENFVSRGMVVDFAVHQPDREDGGIPNPHFHVLCPIRPIEQNGKWGLKQRRVYELDEDGNRIRDADGKFVFNAVPTTDWGSPETLEHWREAWAELCNAKFAEKGLDVRIDHRNYERQGVELLPTVHEGATVRAMEKKGIRTEKGEFNQWIRATNAVIRDIKKKIAHLFDWIAEAKAELAKPQAPDLVSLLNAYYTQRRAGAYSQKGKVSNLKEMNETFNYLRKNGIYTLEDLESRVSEHSAATESLRKTLDGQTARMKAIKQLYDSSAAFRSLKPVYDGLQKIKFEKPRAKYKAEHEAELKQFYAARRKLTGERGEGQSEAGTAPPTAFHLPLHNRTADRAIQYLCESRGLNPKLVEAFLLSGDIYEDAKRHNVVFVGRDRNGTPRYAHVRGTADPFRQDIAGSDKSDPFRYEGNGNQLFVFEAPIDLLSFICLYPQDWQKRNYLALGGVSGKALDRFLSERKDTRKVFLCLDSDTAGSEAYTRLAQSIPGEIAVIRLVPARKDWNDVLRQQGDIPSRKFIAETITLRELPTAQPVPMLRMADVELTSVDWLWFPYIPFGKLTIIQGNPGEGKTYFAMRLAAACTNRKPLPGMETLEPFNIIYQTAEDGLGDTVKPRLMEAEADLERVLVIDDRDTPLTLADERIARAIRENNARLVIIDPVQAFMGADVDMNRANEVRPIFRSLGDIAQATGCAIVLIGHLNKAAGTQSTYRGLGSIDITAAVRSLPFIGKLKDSPTTRVLIHEKSSLAPPGQSLAFSLGDEKGFEWIGAYDITADELLAGTDTAKTESKTAQAQMLILELLADGKRMPSAELEKAVNERGISSHTMRTAKSRIGDRLVTEKDGTVWVCYLRD